MDPKTLVPKPFALLVALALIAVAVVAIEQPWGPKSTAPPPPPDIPPEALQYTAAPDFRGGTGWVNGEDLYLEDLRGQVVLVDFWTYSCINCIRTFPHVQGWYEAYKDDGFLVVGVHTPEFRFERERSNVLEATQRHGLTYPTVQDNDYQIWNAYNNRFWPAKYLIDQWGRLRYSHFGEGAYAETEAMIRLLLTEAGHPPRAQPVEDGVEAPRPGVPTPELYAAGFRASIGNDEGARRGQTLTYAEPAGLDRDRIYLVGTWHNADEHVEAQGPGSVLVRFRAADAVFVATGAQGACVPITLDGRPVPEALRGPDVRVQGNGTCVPMDAERDYAFYAGDFGAHLVRLDVPQGFRLFTFAFSSTGRS